MLKKFIKINKNIVIFKLKKINNIVKIFKILLKFLKKWMIIITDTKTILT